MHKMRNLQNDNVTPKGATSNSKASDEGLKHFINVKEAADYLGVSKSYLDKLRLSGGGPVFHKLGSRVFYRKDDLTAWVRSRRFTSTSEYDHGE
jgi:excisionase family DNA binding protein